MKNTSHGFVALRLEGGILPAEFFQKVANLSAKGQKPGDYRLGKGLSIKDEIGRAWRSAVGEWQNYQERKAKENVDQQEIGVRRWLMRLMKDVLQFEDIEAIKGHTYLSNRAFPLTHRACGGTVPMVLTTVEYQLDKGAPRFGEDGKRRSPHGLVQEFLNADESSLWGIVANGTALRLLRDNPSMTRPAFLEVNLERIFEEELYADFAAFWLILHSSRFTSPDEAPEHCPLELWRAEAHEVGERALASMRDGVTQALRELGSGFLAFPGNEELRTALRGGGLSSMAYYQQLLRLVYRMIFLYTMEDRDLLHGPRSSTAARTLYREGYGISHLREMSLKRKHYNQYPDQWESLQITFRGLADGADPLGLPSLGGLFSADQCPDLDTSGIANEYMLRAVHALGFFRTGTVLARINYHDMDTEELGSVYESLLELHPEIKTDTTPWRFAFAGDEESGSIGGSARKLSGSYYTPDSLVQELIKSALEPVIADTLANNSADPTAALLKLKVIDPACGSGHFLLAAARRLAAELARLSADTGQPDEALYRQCMRTVVRHCIHGVDLNPMAVELCRTALWLETIEPGMPLGFLDSHIRCGNSLVGVRDLAVLKDGIPDEAYKPLTGDEKEIAASLKKDNKAGKKGQKSLFGAATAPKLPTCQKYEELPEESLADIRRKREEFDKARHALDQERLACDLWTSAFYAPKTAVGRELVPLSDDVEAALAGHKVKSALQEATAEIASQQRFFHWPLEFPGVFAKGGFDVVLGNPPWERIKLQEEEFFAARSPEIAKAANKAAREKLIKALATSPNPADQKLFQNFQQAKRDAEATSECVRNGGFFPLTGVGDVNTYALFAELCLRMQSLAGRAGFIVPSGIATDDSTKAYFDELASNDRLVSLFDFENREKLFPAVDSRMKYCLLTLGNTVKEALFTFFATNVRQLADHRRRFTLSGDDIRLLNPNTRTCPVFRSQMDAELTKKIYRRIPVLIDEGKGAEGNPWGMNIRRVFDMAKAEVVASCKKGVSLGCYKMYEAKMLHQFDHRWASYDDTGNNSFDVSDSDKQNTMEVNPKYWMPTNLLDAIISERDWHNEWLLGWRDITNATNERTIISSVLPVCATDFTIRVGYISKLDATNVACLVGNLNSICLDFIARQKIGGTHLSDYITKQLPVISPSGFSGNDYNFIVPRVLELTYSSHSLRPWAEDLGYKGEPFPWNPERRALLRAELDAYYAKLYGLARDELRYILDPVDVMGDDYPSETFRVLKNNEIRQYGEYRTRRLVLEAWDRL